MFRKSVLLFLILLASTLVHAQVPVGGQSASEYVPTAGAVGGSLEAFVANSTRVTEITFPNSFTASKITYWVGTADNTADLYDIGFYSNGGTLLCHIGATAGTTFAPSATQVTLSFVSACSFQGGTRYLLAITGNAATAALLCGNNILLGQAYSIPSAGATTSGGALNASITPAADAWTQSVFPVIALHN